MGIFRSSEQKLIVKQQEDAEIKILFDNINLQLEKNTNEEAREDLRIIINSLVGFFAQENPKMFRKGNSEAYVIKEFLKTLVNIGTMGLEVWNYKKNEAKMQKFMGMFPVIKKYGNVEE